MAHARQRGLLEGHGPALEDRDLLVESFFENGPEGSAAARTRFGAVDGSFAAVLVGRDGGEKHRSYEPIAPGELFALIDAMPMRRREISEGDTGRRPPITTPPPTPSRFS